MTQPLAITSGALTARIDPFGAELVSLTDAAGREYIWSGDPAWWSGRAPLLFPIVGALAGGCYRLDGESYPLDKHGFARRSAFACEEHEEYGWARLALEDSEQTRAVYPFAFRLELYFEIADTTLDVAATVTNRGERSMPFSFGFHPAFAWPLPGGAPKDAHRITFERPEPAPVRRIDPASGLLLDRLEATPIEGRVLTPEVQMFAADALIWDDLSSRACRFDAPGGAAVDLAFPDTPMLGVWQKPGAPFLCIEPWQGVADPHDFAGDIRAKPGIVELAPGAARTFRLTITVTPPKDQP